jgi:hypothetical protein
MMQQTNDWTDGQGEPRERQQRAINHGGLVEY